MKLLLFYFMLIKGIICYSGEHEGRPLYSFTTKQGEYVGHAYRGEILNYLSTGSFEYDEDCGDYFSDGEDH
jgi:hypothetical protein